MGQVVELVNVFILAQIVIKAENIAVKGDNKVFLACLLYTSLCKYHLRAGYRNCTQILECIVVAFHKKQDSGNHSDNAGQ